jgi:hypothetical protein
VLSNWYITALSWVEISFIAIALTALGSKPKLRAQWPSLFWMLLVEFSSDMALMTWLAAPSRRRYYFYTYWISRAVLAVLRFWAIADVIRSFPGMDFITQKVRLFIGVAGLTMVLLAANFCYASHSTMPVKEITKLLNDCVSIAWAAFSLVFLIAVKVFNIGWEPRGAAIAAGLFLRVCSSVVIAEMYLNHSRAVRLTANVLDSLSAIVLYISWSYLFLRPHLSRDRSLDSQDSANIQRNISTLLAYSSSRER